MVLLGFRSVSVIGKELPNRINGLNEQNITTGKTLAQWKEAGGTGTLTFLFYSVVYCQSLLLVDTKQETKEKDSSDFVY